MIKFIQFLNFNIQKKLSKAEECEEEKYDISNDSYLLCVGEYRAKLAIKEFYQKEKIKNKKQAISF